MAKQVRGTARVSDLVVADLKKIGGHPESALAAVERWKNLGAGEVAAALRVAWPGIRKPADRQQLMKAMFHGRHPAALDTLDLGMSDRDPQVKSWAAEFVAAAAFRDFRRDPRGYATWRAGVAGKPLADVVHASAAAFVERLRKTPSNERREASRGLFEAVRTGLLGPLAEAGLVALLEDWVTDGPAEAAENALRVLHRFPREAHEIEQRLSAWLGSRDDVVVRAVLKHLPEYAVTEAFLRANVLPIVRARPAARAAALRALGRKGAKWSVEHLTPWVADSDEDVFLAAAEALAEIGDAKAIPAMVEAMKADPSPSRTYNLGNFGLGPLTGVEYDAAHDGKWWEDWAAGAKKKRDKKKAASHAAKAKRRR
ncbi:MAG: HEAT repeat domain-containing protein [Planctomycetes bacterium]|nr:HEAT repeat domain-containing protein [Planctomycetota bacterium]